MTGSHRVVREGLIVGIIAYAAVALFYAAFDAFAARGSLFTVDMLSRALFGRMPDPALLAFPIQPDLRTIFAYNAVHLVVSLAIGLTVVGLLDHAERHPRRARPVLAVIVAGYVITILVVGALSRTIRAVIPWWSIVTVNSLAVLLAGAYVVRKRPGVAARLAGPPPQVVAMPPR